MIRSEYMKVSHSDEIYIECFLFWKACKVKLLVFILLKYYNSLISDNMNSPSLSQVNSLKPIIWPETWLPVL